MTVDIFFDKVRKRDGHIMLFDKKKIAQAIFKAAAAVGGKDWAKAEELTDFVLKELAANLSQGETPGIEQIQDTVEKVLIEQGHAKTAKLYILYRHRRKELRKATEVVEISELDDRDKAHFEDFNKMFQHKSKITKLIGVDTVIDYKTVLFNLKKMQLTNEISVHPENNYMGDSELAKKIYEKKYFLKNLNSNLIEGRPEDVFARLSAFLAAVENTEKKQMYWATQFYEMLYKGHFMPAGRVIAGAGDLYRLKTLANCFVSLIDDDNLESIYQASNECARTYSYGGGIGVDISCLRPQGSLVHNAADTSTGSVSFMELFSLTTGLIGQSGRRGALMLTIDVKHPDVMHFIKVKKNSNWVTKQIIEQCKWSNKFTEDQLAEIERQVRENTQVRFANISLKVTDEFMQAVEEQNAWSGNEILVYTKKQESVIPDGMQRAEDTSTNYSYGIPSKPIADYDLVGNFNTLEGLNKWLTEKHRCVISEEDLKDETKRNLFGDLLVETPSQTELAIRYAGDYMLYFNSMQTKTISHLLKARDVWDLFIEGNYRTAEPGLVFWSSMTKYSPSNYVGKPIASTNPCGEVPLEDGGACNLGSVNLSTLVNDGYTENASLNWDAIKQTTQVITRFLDNVVTWNETLNPLEKQRKAATETRRIGIGIMGVADMLNQLNLGYDSEEGIALTEKVMQFIANESYKASALLAEEKGQSPIYNENYLKNAFFQEALSEETTALVKEKGIRNIAVLSIAPTGTISNVVLGFSNGTKNYLGVSSGIEPIFSIYYTRRSENFGNKHFKIFHPTVNAYVNLKGLTDQVQNAETVDDLQKILPQHFFRTAHHIDPTNRVKIQGICQKYIDHSISSTVNLPEDIHPEVISNIYLDAWKHNLKGITIYRDGSRYPILSVEGKRTVFQAFKEKTLKVTFPNGDVRLVKGDEVIAKPDGKLTTLYHEIYDKEKSTKEDEQYAEVRV